MTIMSYQVSFCVDSIHGSGIEFALDKAEDRRGKDKGFYENCLYKILKKDLNEIGEIRETQVYGNIIVTIQFYDINNLSGIESIFNKSVSSWKNIYKIENFK